MNSSPFPPHLPDGSSLVAVLTAKSGCSVKRERGSEVVLSPCPFCGKEGDRFAINVDTGLWNCPRCGEKGNAWQISQRLGLDPVMPLASTFHVNGNGHKPAKPRHTQDEVDAEVKERRAELRQNEKVIAYIKARGLTGETAKAWGIVACGNEVGFVYLRDNGRVAWVKYRDVTTKEQRIWPPKDERPLPACEPMYALPDFDASRVAVVTEGEWDAMTLWQAGSTNVVSVAHGAQTWKPEWSAMLASCPKVVLAFDQDDEGEKAAMRCVERFGGERCVRARFGEHKDANDALKDGWEPGDFLEAVECSRHYPLLILKSVRDIISDLALTMRDGTRKGAMRTGWSNLDETQRGLREGELTVVTAHTGAGKTTFTLDLALRLSEAGESVCYFSMEQGPTDTALQIVGMAARRHTEDIPPEELVAVAERVPECFLLGVEPERDRVEQIVAAIRYASVVYATRVAVIDHLDHLIETKERESRYEAASRAVKAMHKVARDHRVHLILICQPTTDSGRHREKGSSKPGEIRLEDIAETRLARQLAHNGWLVDSDKGTRTTTVFVAKARYGGAMEGVRLRYLFDGFRLSDMGREVPGWAQKDPR